MILKSGRGIVFLAQNLAIAGSYRVEDVDGVKGDVYVFTGPRRILRSAGPDTGFEDFDETPENPAPPLTPDERHEIADEMIARWKAWREGDRT